MTRDQWLEEHPPAQRVDLSIWRRIYRYAARYPRLVGGVAALGVAVAAVEVAYPLLTRAVIDDVAENGLNASIGRWTAIHVALTVILALCVQRFVCLAGRLRANVAHDPIDVVLVSTGDRNPDALLRQGFRDDLAKSARGSRDQRALSIQSLVRHGIPPLHAWASLALKWADRTSDSYI